MNKIKNYKKPFLFFAIIAISTVMVYFLFFNRNNNAVLVSTMNAYSGNITKTIDLTGVITSSDYEEISVAPDVKVMKTYVKENDEVEKGQILAELDSTDLLLSIEKAKITLSQLNSDIKDANSNSEAITLKNAVSKSNEEYLKIKSNLQTANENLAKYKQLYDENAISQVEYEKQLNLTKDLQSNLKVAELNYNDTNSNYSDYFVSNKQNIESLKRQINSLNIDIESLNNKLEDSFIYSSISGVVTEFPLTESRNTSINSKIIIYDTSSYEFVSYVAQEDVVLIKEGQKSTIKIKGISNFYEGTVINVGKVAVIDSSSGSKTPKVEVKIKINNPDNLLSSGFDAEAEVEIDSLNNALVIKNESIKNDESNKNYVYIMENGAAKKIIIETGLTDGFSTNVLSGINENDKVVINPPQELFDGVLVKTAK
ncbi:MAG: HlyD family efflux transporter periplasmic adaptor subunit [Bacillota bacterium]|nr:HlyD family efflux transporter periplasmic adaptor subunit [Bacillota bacterium]